MRDFTWHVFKHTGDIEAYLLYKEIGGLGAVDVSADEGSEKEEGSAEGQSAQA